MHIQIVLHESDLLRSHVERRQRLAKFGVFLIRVLRLDLSSRAPDNGSTAVSSVHDLAPDRRCDLPA